MASPTQTSCPRMRSRIDQCIPEEEWALIVFHECMEAEYMERDGMSYDKAHEKVKAEEDAFRRLLVKKKAS